MAGKIKQITCLNCSGAITVRAQGYTKSLACQFCGTVHTLSAEKIEISSLGNITHQNKPLIPLGTRGKLHGAEWEVIGFMERVATYTKAIDPFIWHEYLLFNPYKGFRWLTESNGHWNYVCILHDIPKYYSNLSVHYLNEKFVFHDTYQATVSYVIGEFYWQVKIDDISTLKEYHHQTRILSIEMLHLNAKQRKYPLLHIGGVESKQDKTQGDLVNESEEIWSISEYMEAKEIIDAFHLKTSLPHRTGIVINQPLPASHTLSIIAKTSIASAVLLIAISFGFLISSNPKSLFQDSLVATSKYQTTTETKPYVSPVFEIDQERSLLLFSMSADLHNAAVDVEGSLVNNKTGEARNFTAGLEYFTGHDSDGAWVEGKQRDSWTLSALPKGQYQLILKTDAGYEDNIPLRIEIIEGIRGLSNFAFSLLLVLAPAIVILFYFLLFNWVKRSKNDDDSNSRSWEDFWD